MVDVIGEIEKGLKKVTDFLEITPAEEPHHSEPYNPPRGRADQVLKNRPFWTYEEERREKEAKERRRYTQKRFKPHMVTSYRGNGSVRWTRTEEGEYI